MKVSRRTVLWSTAGWVGVVLVLVAWVAFLWSMPLLAQIVASLALLAFAFTLAVLYQDYYDWLIGQIMAVGLEDELADLGWEPLPTELKMKAHEADRETSREAKLHAAGGKVEEIPQPTPPPRVGPDYTAYFHRWKDKPPLPDQPSFTELVAQVTGEPGSEPKSEPPSEDEAQEIVDQVVEKYPFLPKPEGVEE